MAGIGLQGDMLGLGHINPQSVETRVIGTIVGWLLIQTVLAVMRAFLKIDFAAWATRRLHGARRRHMIPVVRWGMATAAVILVWLMIAGVQWAVAQRQPHPLLNVYIDGMNIIGSPKMLGVTMLPIVLAESTNPNDPTIAKDWDFWVVLPGKKPMEGIVINQTEDFDWKMPGEASLHIDRSDFLDSMLGNVPLQGQVHGRLRVFFPNLSDEDAKNQMNEFRLFVKDRDGVVATDRVLARDLWNRIR